MNKLTVIDFFCGAGGFSEGFKQQGFEIKLGIDCWEPAIRTFNHNFGLNCTIKNILDFENSIDEIEALPDTDVIIGSPPCVTFSSSNISGKADKTSGITLTQIFLRIVAVKKWKKGSRLKAWFMENVPSSIKHLGQEYTFEDLGLGEWAKKNKIGRSKIAIRLEGNQQIVNSANYGSPQVRERVISGEIIIKKKLILPEYTHTQHISSNTSLKQWVALKYIKDQLPRPNCPKSDSYILDPNYSNVTIRLDNLTDHFYDTGLFECEWKQSKFLKTNHPYMGKMSFPENEDRPSRTITATKIGTSRESIIYMSENKRTGNGEFRTPTVREAACIMGFPITFQFIGTEGLKWRLVGNAVCPSVSRALAKQVRKELNLNEINEPIIQTQPIVVPNNDLNSFSLRIFETPPRKTTGSRFRRHPFKDGNITVTLSNYDIDKIKKSRKRWKTSVQYGNGEGFPTFNLPDGFYNELEVIIKSEIKGKEFLDIVNNGFLLKIAKGDRLQEMYEIQHSDKGLLEPTLLVDEVARMIEVLNIGHEKFIQNKKIIFKNKQVIPLKQLFALYAINKISSITNSKD
jgi:DNA (cytosine-5)-methyltransferase 1